MLRKIFIIIVGIIVAIPILLWFAIRGIVTGSWKLLGFICQRQYRELRQLCENGTEEELQTFLAAHPGAKEYIVYTRQNWASSIVTTLFRLPAPLAVAGHANNLAVIPILLANGASPEVRSVSSKHSPAEEAIGEPEKMRALCGGKTWWLERTAKTGTLEAAINEHNLRSIVWNTMRGARLTNVKQLCSSSFSHLPKPIMAFICRFGIDKIQREDIYAQLKRISSEELKQMTTRRVKRYARGYADMSWQKDFTDMLQVLEDNLQPLPVVDDDAMDRLMFSAGLLDRKNMLELIDNLFSQEQQFALLDLFTTMLISQDDREMVEETVDLLLCSILERAER